MKKLTLIFAFILSMNVFVSNTNANWYGAHAVGYAASGFQECNDDGDTTGGVGDVSQGKDHRVTAWGGATAGNMTCEYWDGALPVASASNVTNIWVGANIPITLFASDAGGSGLSSARYTWDNANCWAGTPYGNGTNLTLSTEGAHALYLCVTDVAGNTSTWNGAYYLDKTAPNLSTDITNSNAGNLLANNAYSYSMSVGVNGGSPITLINALSEDSNNPAATTARSSPSGTLMFSWDMQNVDIARQTNGGRQYTFTVTRICDQVGNCSVGTRSWNHDVYANSWNIATKTVLPHNLSSGQVADGAIQPMPIRLADAYGNIIIPATGIGRTVDFNFNLSNNTLYLNQHTRTGDSAVFVQPPVGGGFLNTIPASYNSQPSTTGQYTFNFKIFTPTYQNYQADPNGKFTFTNITFDINGSIGAISSQVVANSNIDFSFIPLYQTAITGDLKSGIIEGARQDSILSVNKNGSRNDGDISSRSIDVEFSGTDSGKFNMYGGTTTTLSNTNHISIFSALQSPIIFPTSTSPSLSNNLYTKLIQKPGVVGNTLSGIYLSTHISYSLDGNDIVYNSDIIGKNNYFGVNTDFTKQEGLKILGTVSTKKSQELTTNQFSKDVKIIGDTNKFTNKTSIIMNAFNLINSSPIGNQTIKTITKLDGTNTVGRNLSNNGVIYFGELSGQNVILGDGVNNVKVIGKRTVLVVGGNIYIRSNIYYNSISQDTLGIIALKDSAGNGGNIYIDPDVTNIAGTLFAEKSIISYDGAAELDGFTPAFTLRNQLHIYGSTFSENTIGGSRKSTPQCPFYITSGCTTAVAQKYDLNYLRRYYLVNDIYPYGNGKVIGGGTCNYTNTCGAHDNDLKGVRFFTSTSNQYASYPVIIEYNPNNQKNPPPLFKKRQD